MDEHWPPLPPSVITDTTIRDRCFRAFTRLYLRAWNGNTLTPIRLSEEELCALLHKSRAQAYSLLAEMTSAKLIRWYRDGPFFRITAAFHAPAPHSDGISVESGNPDSDEKKSGFPDSAVISSLEIQTRISESRKVRQGENGSALKESLIKSDDDDDGSIKTHHHSSARGESGFLDSTPDEATLALLGLVLAQAERWLITAGVWADEAERLAMTLAENEVLKAYNAHIPTRADILGWIVALQNRDDVQKPDAMLARNLKYGRRAPAKLRPPQVCGTCERIEGYCRCAMPVWRYPDALLERALDEEVDTWCCHVCHAVPCACPPEPVSVETPPSSRPSPPESADEYIGHGEKELEPEVVGWNGIGMAPERAFQAALAQLQMEMPKATFNTWVRDTQFAGYAGSSDNHGKFTLAFHNPYARDWVESRLNSTLARILEGLMNQPIELEFIA